MTAPWIQTFGGRKLEIFNPDPAAIDLADIAHSLSMLCRFTGHTRDFYSVAQHAVLVARECPTECRAWGLMHDAAEAYINDISRPVKERTCLVVGDEFAAASAAMIGAVEDNIDFEIAKKFNVPWPLPQADEAAIKAIDTKLLLTEKRDLMAPEPAPWGVAGEPFDWHIEPWSHQKAEREFLWSALDYGVVKAGDLSEATLGMLGQDDPRSILQEAMDITSKARREAYGHPRDNFSRIADIWSVVLEKKLEVGRLVEPADVARCMIGVKLAREVNIHTRDNAVDIAGYARTLAIVEGDEE